jgi:protein-S-isoprenylcysteine O-methyltransferase Ste14
MDTETASPPNATVRLGRWLFRWRGLTPVPIVLLLLGLAARELRHPSVSPGVDLVLAAAGLASCLLGQCLRAWVRGQVPLDTSNQGRALSAGSLNVAGAYRFTRNPLYLGNLMLTSGLLLQLDSLWAVAIGLAFFFFEYHFIIRAEEAFLLERFGDRYARFVAEVPRFWPRLRPATSEVEPSRFDAARVLRTEHNGAAGWIAGALVARLLQAEARAPALALRPALPWLIALAAVGAVYLAVKGWKRGWWWHGRAVAT